MVRSRELSSAHFASMLQMKYRDSESAAVRTGKRQMLMMTIPNLGEMTMLKMTVGRTSQRSLLREEDRSHFRAALEQSTM